MVYKQPKSKNWWYKFNWNGKTVRESSKQTNKRVAEQMEAARRTALAKGEVGIHDKKPVPTLGVFADVDFLPFVRATSAAKPRTVVFYQNSVRNLKRYGKMAGLPLDAITSETIAGFVARRQESGMRVSTINRDLATLRRMFHLAQEWGTVSTILPKVKMLPGENHRERVLTPDEESSYLNAAAPLLRDVATILVDCGLRPEECYRLKWENIREGAVEIFQGKRKGSRRRVPGSDRVLATLEMRKTASTSEWVFPAPTKTGHIETSSLKKQHQNALRASGVSRFVIYDLRHTCLTRWAKVMDPFTLKTLAGHTDLSTTARYVHLNDGDVRAAMAKANARHTFGHTSQGAAPGKYVETPAIN